jgi:hypothetical protein
MKVGSDAFLRFDSNAYSVHAATIGRRVDLRADLSHIRVLCDGKMAAEHDRAWTRERTIRDPTHGTAPADAGSE